MSRLPDFIHNTAVTAKCPGGFFYLKNFVAITYFYVYTLIQYAHFS